MPAVKSWKTTVLGVCTILAAVTAVVVALVDNDPATNPNWEATVAALMAGVGLIFAKDSNVSNSPTPGAAVKVPSSTATPPAA